MNFQGRQIKHSFHKMERQKIGAFRNAPEITDK